MERMGAGEVSTGFWWRDLIVRDLGVGGKLKMDH